MQHLDELDEATIDAINRGLLRRYWTETPKHLRPQEEEEGQTTARSIE